MTYWCFKIRSWFAACQNAIETHAGIHMQISASRLCLIHITNSNTMLTCVTFRWGAGGSEESDQVKTEWGYLKSAACRKKKVPALFSKLLKTFLFCAQAINQEDCWFDGGTDLWCNYLERRK